MIKSPLVLNGRLFCAVSIRSIRELPLQNINNDKNGEVFMPRRFVMLMIIQNNSGLTMLRMIIAKLWKYEPIQYL